MVGLQTKLPHTRVPRMAHLASLPGILLLLLSSTLMTISVAQTSAAAEAAEEKERTRAPGSAPAAVEVDQTDELIVYDVDYYETIAPDQPYIAYSIYGDAAEEDVSATGATCEFLEDSNGIPVCVAALESRRACAGGTAYGFAIDASTSMTAARTAVVTEQIAAFISSTARDDDPNPNIYYANQFSANGLFDFTPFFDGSFFATNAGQRMANAVRALQPDLTPGDTANIVGGIDDLTLEFGRLTDVHAPVYSAIAFIITDGPLDSAPTDVATAIADLQSSTLASLGVPVTTVAIGLGPTVIRSELQTLASRPDLVFEARFYNTFAPDLTIATLSIDTDGDGVNDCDDGCPTDPATTSSGNCMPPGSIPCAGSFAFLVDASGSLSSSDFADAVSQISMFIDGSSEFAAAGAANTNEYYAISYTTDIEDRTNTFNANAFGGVAQQVSSFSDVGGGSKDTSVALTDVFRRFVLQREGLPSDARFAFVITDGIGESAADVAQAADLLSGEEVVVIAFPPAGSFDQAVVDAIATDQSGTTRVVPVANYAALGSIISSTLASIDSDSDGAIDCADSCPMDADKLTGGVCGCGFTDPPPGGQCP